jgi:hypothetical protein
VPDATPPLFQLPKPSLKHLFLSKAAQRLDFKGRGRGKTPIQELERRRHASLLSRQLSGVSTISDEIQEAILEETLPEMEGIVIKITTAAGYPLGAQEIQALTTRTGKRSGPFITLLHAMQMEDDDGQPYTRIVLHVPFGGLTYLEEKIRQFAGGSGTKGKHAFLANVNSIAQAALEELWTDPAESLPADEAPHWWQLWIRKYPVEVWDRFQAIRNSLELEVKGEELILPEHRIVLVRATYTALASSLPLLDCLGEVRGAHPCSLGLTELSASEQREYVEEALGRIRQPGVDAPAVCLLDTGVNRGHHLLQNLLAPEDAQSVFADGDSSDAYINQIAHGHGTPMAGLAAYGDLRVLLGQTEAWDQHHRLESVRLFDPNNPNDPDNYGSVTLQAVALPEIQSPQRKRVFSLAITAPGPDDGRPTAWSAAVDAAAFGDEGPAAPKRLILVSTGNVKPDEYGVNYAYPDDNRNSPIQDPAQAWNAVTVGALTHRDKVQESDDESQRLVRLARQGDLSPFSRTACDWEDHWPIKPEIVMEGGNAAFHPEHGPDYRESLELISTSAMGALGRDLCSCHATSAATAQAARLAAGITVRYPTIRPETVRGLLVHAARWNNMMLDGVNPHRAYNAKRNNRAKFVQTLRSFGFGEPDAGRCNFSAGHAVTMIREDQLQPYALKENNVQLKDCHVHTLPWPKELLQQNFASTISLRVTLSYFTAPNPSANNALGSSRYRYGGCLLRFLVRHKDESLERFEARLKRTAREGDESTTGASSTGSTRTDTGWALGGRLCGKGGSLIQDVWEGTAAQLLTMDRIAVYPVKGWWAARRNFPEGDRWHNCHELPIRYSLIVSVESQQDIPLYNEIHNLIQVPVEAT